MTITYEELQQLKRQHANVPVIEVLHNLVERDILSEEEFINGMMNAIPWAIPEGIKLPLERIKALFAHNAIRVIVEASGFYPSGSRCYILTLCQAPGNAMTYSSCIVNKEYIDVPQAVVDFMNDKEQTKNIMYLFKREIVDINRIVSDNGLVLQSNFSARVQEFFMKKTEGFRREMRRNHSLDKDLAFSSVLSFLTLEEKCRLSEVCSSADDQDVINNRDASVYNRARFDKRFGLLKI